MAKITAADLPTSINEDGEGVWETVADESAQVILLDKPGDQFIGTYLGEDHIEPENGEAFDRFLFHDSENKPVALNKSYKLEEAMKAVEPGDMVRVTYTKDITTRRNLNPLKDYKVEVRRSSSPMPADGRQYQ